MPRKTPKKPVHREREHHKYSDRIMELHDYKCSLCNGLKADTIDHVVPVAWGGSDHPCNLKPAHRSCNSSKGADRPELWTWTVPLMWEPGYGANVEGMVKVPHAPYAGVKLFVSLTVLGGLITWLGYLQGTLLFGLIGIVLLGVPIFYNVLVRYFWVQRCERITLEAREDETIADPKEWFEDAFLRKP